MTRRNQVCRPGWLRHFDIVESELGQAGRSESHQVVDGFNFKAGSSPGNQTSHGTLLELSKYQKYPGELPTGYPFLVDRSE